MNRFGREGFMSYTRDSSLRQHTFGKIEPMDYPRANRPWLLILGVAAVAVYVLWRVL